MLIFIASGRLGNQIFQYMFLKNIQQRKEHIVAGGFDQLKEIFNVDAITIIPCQTLWMRKFVYILLNNLLTFLSNKKIISSIKVNHEPVLKYKRETCSYTYQKGLFSFIKFVHLGFFQSEAFFKQEDTKHLIIKAQYLTEAKDLLNKIPKDAYKVFVHIRRGDYQRLKIYGQPTLLPIEFFYQQIEWFLKYKKGCFFILLTDDIDYVKEKFMYLENKVIFDHNHYGVDFALMTLSDGAILSPSSFSWWGAYFMHQKTDIIAPKHWLGFQSGIDFPKQPLASFMKSVEVDIQGIGQ